MAEPVTTSTGAAPATEHGRFPPFESQTFPAQVLWLVLSFALLYWLMSRFALPRIAAVLENRTDRIAGDLAQAEKLKSDSEAAAAAYEKSLADARDRAKAIAQEMREALNAEAEGKRKALESELADKLAAAEATIRTKTAEAMSNVRGIATETAAAIVERLTGEVPERTQVEAALERTFGRQG